MRINLTDVTFIILVRIDSIERIENILAITNQLSYYFHTNIMVHEASSYNNGVLKSILSRNILYTFIKDIDPVLHKTKHYNLLVEKCNTPLISIWDADIVVEKKTIINAIFQLRNGIDVVYPYSGVCYNVPDIIRKLFLSKKDIRMLYRNIDKMELLYNFILVGGAVIFNKEKYNYAGKENESHYGWGNDDYDRYYRFLEFGLSVKRIETSLFHLNHPRVSNSDFRASTHENVSARERFLAQRSSKQELLLNKSKH